MNIIYRAWENRHEDRNIMHPDRSIYEGGINHLPEEERQKIIQTRTVPKHLCCTDPYWLFRIYQDTNVTVPEVEKLISNALAESATKRLSGRDFGVYKFFHESLTNLRSKYSPFYDKISNNTMQRRDG
jgi:protein O-mannose beta-1,4-N-acetylglucosaminyltransferase